jgi:hypothetical protein
MIKGYPKHCDFRPDYGKGTSAEASDLSRHEGQVIGHYFPLCIVIDV